MSPLAPLPPSSHATPVDAFGAAAELERELKRTVRGEVRFDRGSRALYATDGSNYRQIPIGLVIPVDEDDVAAAVAACRKYAAPVLPRGAGTSLAGQCCNTAVVLDFTKYMHRLVELDPDARTATVQPGLVLDSLRNAAEAHGLTFGPDPSTHSRCTLGGMIGNNSCGTHSLLAGKTVDNIESMRVLLYDGTRLTVGRTSESELDGIIGAGGRRGELYSTLRSIRDRYAPLVRSRFPDIPRRVSGYNLDQLLPEHGFNVARALVGSEGTCAIVLEATVGLVPSPPHRTLVGLGCADIFTAADHVVEILECGPVGLEGFEGVLVDALRRKGAPNLDLLPPGRGILLAEFGASDAAEAEALARRLIDRARRWPGSPEIRLYATPEARAVWKIREAGPRAAISLPGQPPRYEGWDDAAVPPARLGDYLRDLRRLLDEYGYDAAYYGHFGHGCIHMQVSFDLRSEPGIRAYGEFVERAADLVVRYGGSISGEHGDGQARGALLPKMFGPELMEAFRTFKGAWDPDRRLNPGKLIDASPPTANLRLGADFAPIDPPTHFRFPDDGGSMSRATLRCIGIGECRKQESGTMCPSYMATLEEAHSTRGRAHMLFEMLQGEAIADGWASEHVRQSLDLCLSCKACKSECPANVDVAAYRAEFLAHYYETHARPLQAYAFGLVDRWARAASTLPRTTNALLQLPGAEAMLRRLLHVAPARRLPRLARVSFRRWARERGVPVTGASSSADVVLWLDTFSNYFRPDTATAALDVLRAAGHEVAVPARDLCCGRPLYDFGFLATARTYLQRVMDALAPEIDAGKPIVVLEPSCASVFRDELRNFFPDDARAERLRRQTFLLGEYLQQVAGYVPPRRPGRVLLHGHCHQKALMSMDPDERLLRAMGAEVERPDGGCCGMAGAFGYAADSYAVAQAIGERRLLPAVRAAAPDTTIVADGFSCREQIRQSTSRRALHLAEALRLALPSPRPDTQ